MPGPMSARLRGATRRFLLGRGPLKRNSDRLQMAGRLLVLLALLAAVPLALVAAGLTRTRLEAEAVAQAADRHEIRAVVLRDSTTSTTADGASASGVLVRARISWRGPSGGVRHSLTLVPAGAVAGTTLPVWVDRRGNLTTPPPDATSINDTEVVIGMAVGAGIPLAAWALHSGLCLLLDIHRTRRWGRDWARVEREWRAHSG